MIKKARIRDLDVYSFRTKEDFLQHIDGKQKILVSINAEMVMKDDSRLHKIINANIGFADGTGAVMALKQKGLEAIKIPGCEFWLDIIKKYFKSKTFYILGSKQNVIEKTVDKLQRQFPGINIVGYRNGYLNKSSRDALNDILLELTPDIVFVAQGAPAQEYLMDDLMRVHPALYMGLGGSFDIYCGIKKRAPQVFLNTHTEWLYRLIDEPTRITRQLVLVKFLILLKLGKI